MRLGFFGLEELNFVEFNITGDDLNYHRLREESYYLGSEVFNLFVSCFEKSNELYEYFEPSKYNARKIVVLRNELLAYSNELNKIISKEVFISYLENIIWGNIFIAGVEKEDPTWRENWENYLNTLKTVNKELVSIVERCIDESRILWVLGY
jgi:hypothetical protein